MTLRILGVDPGSRHTGFGVVERHGSRLRAVTHGRISPPAKLPLAARLAALSAGIREVVAAHRPDVAVLETPFHGLNPKTLIVLAQARGALLAAIAESGLGTEEYAPAEIKSAVTGNGRADKEQVARMVELVLGLDRRAASSDASDALAVAICYAQRARLDHLGGRSRRPANPSPRRR